MRLKFKWAGKGLYCYVSRRELLLIRRGFRDWVRGVGVWPLPAFTWAALDAVLTVYLEELSMKRIKPSTPEVTRYAALDARWSKDYPSLLGFLADGEYDLEDGGGKRERGLVSIWATGGAWHMKLRDNDSGHVCFVAGASWHELLCAADAVCSDPAGGWKPEPGATQRRKK